MSAGVWHAGERAVQLRAGTDARVVELGSRLVREYMPDQHRDFFALLPFVLAGTVDPAGQPRASVAVGPPGFVHSPDAQTLRIDGAIDRPVQVGDAIALLGLQAHTGRRNRVNGRVAHVDATGFAVRVGQSFGNCPRYIHRREAMYSGAVETTRLEVLAGLDAASRNTIGAADTFFIATAHPEARNSTEPSLGLDISHRGGPPGFVQFAPNGALLVPDYVGNSYFNTFGNLELEPRCALLFIDYITGERLHLCARAEVVWQEGARMLRATVTRVEIMRGGLPLHWRAPELTGAADA